MQKIGEKIVNFANWYLEEIADSNVILICTSNTNNIIKLMNSIFNNYNIALLILNLN